MRPRERVLEIGAGTGALLWLVAPHIEPGGQLVLLDASQRVLNVALEFFTPKDLATLASSVMTWTSCPSPIAILMLYSVIWGTSGKSEGAHEAYRVLWRGGRIAIAVWGPLTRHGEWRLTRRPRAAMNLKGHCSQLSVRPAVALPALDSSAKRRRSANLKAASRVSTPAWGTAGVPGFRGQGCLR